MNLIKSLIKSIFELDSPDFIGKAGENLTARKLGWVKLFGRGGKLLQNIYVPKPDGTTTEIDLLYITVKGIFVIESKNYSGYIFGNDKNPKWTVTLYAGKDWLGRKKVEKHQFYNPIWQNKTHIKYLKKFIGEDIQTISLIVFSERCKLKSIEFLLPDTSNTYVCNRDQLPRVVRYVWQDYPDVLTEEKIESIYKRLFPFTNVDEAVKLQHVQNINNFINNTEICPRCGGKLILRTAKSGAYAGQHFYGCSNYPRCKYIKNLGE